MLLFVWCDHMYKGYSWKGYGALQDFPGKYSYKVTPPTKIALLSFTSRNVRGVFVVVKLSTILFHQERWSFFMDDVLAPSCKDYCNLGVTDFQSVLLTCKVNPPDVLYVGVVYNTVKRVLTWKGYTMLVSRYVRSAYTKWLLRYSFSYYTRFTSVKYMCIGVLLRRVTTLRA